MGKVMAELFHETQVAMFCLLNSQLFSVIAMDSITVWSIGFPAAIHIDGHHAPQ